MQAVILAGGRGTRLHDVTGAMPKTLVDIGGKPLLVHQLELIARTGIRNVLLLTGYRSEKISEAIGDGVAWGLSIVYQQESETKPLGTAGALLDAFESLQDHILVMYGDTMIDVDLDRLLNWHKAQNADATLFVHPNDHPEDSDLVKEARGRITGFHPYPHPEGALLPNLVNAALYVVEKSALAPYCRLWRDGTLGEKPDIAKNLFPRMLEDGARLFAYRSPEYIKDAGTPKRYATVLRDLSSGRIARANLAHRQKAIFLDRDGTLNMEVGRISTPASLVLIDGVGSAVRRINESEYRAIVITNQPVIARGDCDEKVLAAIHAKLDTLLGRSGAYLDALYYCPHHPDGGFAGEVADLKFDCDCRKPKPGLLRRAQADLNIDFPQSWLIGDTTVDMAAANELAIRSVLVMTGKMGQDGICNATPDYTFDTLGAAVSFILDRHPGLIARALEISAPFEDGNKVILEGDGDLLLWRSLLTEATRLHGVSVNFAVTKECVPSRDWHVVISNKDTACLKVDLPAEKMKKTGPHQ